MKNQYHQGHLHISIIDSAEKSSNRLASSHVYWMCIGLFVVDVRIITAFRPSQPEEIDGRVHPESQMKMDGRETCHD